jgi:hypothetical protein
MRKRFINSIVVLCLLTIGSKVANAQDTNRLEVEIPFSFMLQDRELPASKYRLERIDQSKPNLLALRSTNGHIVRLVLTQRSEKESPSTATYLLFKRRGEKLYLFQVWTAGAMNGVQIPSIDENESDQRTDSTSFVRLKIQNVSNR